MADFNVSTLSQRIKQDSTDILIGMVAGASSLKSPYIIVKDGIKGGTAELIYLAENTLEFQSGLSVSTPSGGTEITAVSLQTSTYTHYNTFYGQNLAAKYPQILRAGATSEIDIPQIILDDYTKKVNNAVSLAAWRGNYNSYANDINIDGWLKEIHAQSASTYSVNGTGGATLLPYAFSAANSVALIRQLMRYRPAGVVNNGVEIHMDPAILDEYRLGLIDQNNYFNDPTGDPTRVKCHGFSNVVAVADDGLQGSKAIVAITENCLAFGCDLLSDQDDIATGYNEEFNRTWMRITMSVGTKVVRPAEIGMIRWA